MSYICSSCGKEHKGKNYPDNLCQGCYNYFRKGGQVNPIPQFGTIGKDYRGYIVCHKCGKAYVRLGSHVKESHNMTIHEYKDSFGLCESSHTTETSYSNMMKRYAYDNDMPNQLKETGIATRIKKGEKLRLGKQARLQEVLNKKAR